MENDLHMQTTHTVVRANMTFKEGTMRCSAKYLVNGKAVPEALSSSSRGSRSPVSTDNNMDNGNTQSTNYTLPIDVIDKGVVLELRVMKSSTMAGSRRVRHYSIYLKIEPLAPKISVSASTVSSRFNALPSYLPIFVGRAKILGKKEIDHIVSGVQVAQSINPEEAPEYADYESFDLACPEIRLSYVSPPVAGFKTVEVKDKEGEIKTVRVKEVATKRRLRLR